MDFLENLSSQTTLRFLGLLLCLGLSSEISRAELPESLDISITTHEEPYGLDGEVKSMVYYRNKPKANKLLYSVSFPFFFAIDREAAVRIRGKASTGSFYVSTFNTAKDFEATDETLSHEFALRRLFIEYQYNEFLRFEMGAIPSKPEDSNSNGKFSASSNGWVDGARVSFDFIDAAFPITGISVTAGSVEDVQEVNLFDRDFHALNLYQIHIGGVINGLTYGVEASRFNDHHYLRWLGVFTIKPIVKLLDSIGLEVLIDERDEHLQGMAINVTKKVRKWSFEVGYFKTSDWVIDQWQADEKFILPFDPFYRASEEGAFYGIIKKQGIFQCRKCTLYLDNAWDTEGEAQIRYYLKVPL